MLDAWEKPLLAIAIGVFVLYVGWMTRAVDARMPVEIFSREFVHRTSPRDEKIIDRNIVYDRTAVFLGRERGRKKRLLVVSPVRNCVGSIPCMESKMKVLSRVFRRVHVVLFENNSTDGTRTELLRYARGEKTMGGDNVKVTVVNPLTLAENEPVCNLTAEVLLNEQKGGIRGTSAERISRMVFLRNQVLSYVYANQRRHDMLLMTDMDIVGRFFEKGIQETIGYLAAHPETGFVSFRGLTPTRVFFDPYTFRGRDPLSQSALVSFLTCIRSHLVVPVGRGMYPVETCHSGGAFINLPLPRGLRYDLEHVVTIPGLTSVYLCEHVTMMKKVKNNVINTNMVFLVNHHI